MNNKTRHPSVILADTDANSVTALRAQVERLDYLVHVVDTPARLNSLVQRIAPAALLIDVDFGGDGFRHVKNLQQQGLLHCLAVLFLAFRPNVEDAVRAMRMAAEDYLVKPVSQTQLSNALLKSLPHQSEQPAHATGSEYFSGHSQPMKLLRQGLQMAAPTDATVLIIGEPGTGKHQMAKELHRHSGRRARPFVSVDTSSWRGEEPMQVELALFGHEKGVVAGTNVQRPGACSRANGGTLFLDEIADLQPAHQSILLRFLQERKSRAVGSDVVQDINVRVIAASRYSSAELAQGSISSELLFELDIVPLVIPPLRTRSEDIADLAQLLCRRFAQQHGRDELQIAERVITQLKQMPWQGNVRELSNLIEKLVVLSPGHIIETLPNSYFDAARAVLEIPDASRSFATRPTAVQVDPQSSADLTVMDQLKVQAIQAALADADGHVGKAAKILGIGQATLYRKLRHFGIRRNGVRIHASADLRFGSDRARQMESPT